MVEDVIKTEAFVSPHADQASAAKLSGEDGDRRLLLLEIELVGVGECPDGLLRKLLTKERCKDYTGNLCGEEIWHRGSYLFYSICDIMKILT